MIFHKVLSLAHTHQPYHSKNSSEIGDFEMEKARDMALKLLSITITDHLLCLFLSFFRFINMIDIL